MNVSSYAKRVWFKRVPVEESKRKIKGLTMEMRREKSPLCWGEDEEAGRRLQIADLLAPPARAKIKSRNVSSWRPLDHPVFTHRSHGCLSI